MNTAGWGIAPLVRKLVNRGSPILNIKPQSLFQSEMGLKKYKIRGTNL